MRLAQLFRMSSLVVVVALCTLVGCSTYNWPFPSHDSVVDDGWGDAFETNVANMTANPDAGEVGEPIALDSATGELVDHGYHEEQKLGSDASDMSSMIRIDSGQ